MVGESHVCVSLLGTILLHFSPCTNLLSALSLREGACWAAILIGNEAHVLFSTITWKRSKQFSEQHQKDTRTVTSLK